MANSRIELDGILQSIPGVSKVYFPPPESVKLKYPCIIYERTDADTQFANNTPYHFTWAYEVTVIDPNPDSTIPAAVAALPMSRFGRHFTSDNLNHDVFIVYY